MPNGSDGRLTTLTLGAYEDANNSTEMESIFKESHNLNSHILLQASPANRHLMHRWMMMAKEHPDAFCSSHPQDQTAWTILIRKQPVPLVSFCAHLDIRKSRLWNCHRDTKTLPTFLGMIQSRQFDVVSPAQVRRMRCSSLEATF